MNSDAFDALLRPTLADGRLEGAEQDALLAWAHKHFDSEADRNSARKKAFAVAASSLATEEARQVLGWLEDVVRVLNASSAPPAGAPASACFSPGPDCLGQIVSRFANARRSADVCVFTVTDDRIVAAMLDAHRRGVKLRLITDNDKANDLGSDVDRLAAAGVPTKIDRTVYHMHHKFAIFDGTRLLNGSYNWTRGAADQNEENVIDTGDAPLVAAFQRQFDALWAKL